MQPVNAVRGCVWYKVVTFLVSTEVAKGGSVFTVGLFAF